MPYILIQGLVLGLIAEVHLVLYHHVGVFYALNSSFTDLREGLAPCTLFVRYGRSALTMNGGVLTVRLLAVVVASAEFLLDFT